MIFRCRPARACFNSQDAAVVLTKTVDDLTSSPLKPESVVRYTNLVEQVKLCLQDHEIYPRTSNFHHEMNESMLELIFFYLRFVDSPNIQAGQTFISFQIDLTKHFISRRERWFTHGWILLLQPRFLTRFLRN